MKTRDLWCLRSKDSAAPRHKWYPNRYQRLDMEKAFQTCLTTINPSGKNGAVNLIHSCYSKQFLTVQVLHPTQHRVLTVREFARAMGFPDSFTWDHDTQSPRDMYKQIGNAVAIPVGRALGRELLKVMITKWEQDGTIDDPNAAKPSIEFDDDYVEMSTVPDQALDSDTEGDTLVADPNDVWMYIDHSDQDF